MGLRSLDGEGAEGNKDGDRTIERGGRRGREIKTERVHV